MSWYRHSEQQVRATVNRTASQEQSTEAEPQVLCRTMTGTEQILVLDEVNGRERCPGIQSNRVKGGKEITENKKK